MSFCTNLKTGTFKTLHRKLSSGKPIESPEQTHFMADEMLKMLVIEITQYFLDLGTSAPQFHAKEKLSDRLSSRIFFGNPASKSIGVCIETSIGAIDGRTLVAPSKDHLVA